MSSKPVVLVTGCSDNGIGSALCMQFAQSGCAVYATARNVDSMKNLRQFQNISLLSMDVTEFESIKSAVSEVLDSETKIDILVNNAGISATHTVLELPMELATKMHDTNVLGSIRLIQAVAPSMIDYASKYKLQIESGMLQKPKIVNVGSVVGLMSTPLASAYCASKAALHAYSDCLRMELKPFNVDVVVVAPGAIISNLANNNINSGSVVESKYFSPQTLDKRAKASQGPKSTKTDDFAKATVKEILQTGTKSSKAYFLYGYMSAVTYILSFFPAWISDPLMSKAMGLNSASIIYKPRRD